MTKHLISVFGAPFAGKTQVSRELTTSIPGAVRYGTYDEAPRPFALERPLDIQRAYGDIGDLLLKHDVVVIDEDPVAMAAMAAFRHDSLMSSSRNRNAAHQYYRAGAGYVLPTGDRIQIANVHVSVEGETIGDRLDVLENRAEQGGTNDIGRIAFINDVGPLLEAGDEYAHHLELSGELTITHPTNAAGLSVEATANWLRRTAIDQ